MLDQIYCLDSHKPCVFFTEFCDVNVFNGSIIWCLRTSSTVAVFSKFWCALLYVALACWRWATVEFVAMAEIALGSSRSSHGVPIANTKYRVTFMIRPTCPRFHQSKLLERWWHCHKTIGSFYSSTNSTDLYWLWVDAWWQTWQQPCP